MTPISTLIRAELVKLLRRPMTWILALSFLGVSLIIFGSLVGMILVGDTGEGDLGVSAAEATDLRETILPPDAVFFSATLVQLIGTILLIILAAGSVGSEFNWATFRTNVFMGAARSRMFVSKVLALQIITLAMVVLGIAWGLGLSVLSWAIVGEGDAAGVGFSTVMIDDLLLSVIVNVVTIGLWVLIAAGITLVTHSLATGLGLTLVLSFLGGQIVVLIRQLGTTGEWISRVFPNASADAIAALMSSDPPDYGMSDWTWIAVNMVGWGAVIIVFSITRFRRMNLLSAG